MRAFIVVALTARSSPGFSLKNLPGSSGRLDVVCRCLVAALTGAGGVRRDTLFCAVLDEGASALIVEGWKVGTVPRSELGVARVLRRVFAGERVDGFRLERAGFREVVGMVAGGLPLFYLHEEGAPLWSVDLPVDAAFVLGSHLDLPPEYEDVLGGLGAVRVSLGPRRYLASHCVTLVHHEIDCRMHSRKAL
ncbi:MAG: tRNA (pseudouridine(54)-N(1))-methyltransferase TrmY [Candidatus Jordarchaeales archaeon]